MGSLQHSMANLFNRNHGTHEESSPQEGSSNKALINPIWKFRILAILAICVLVIPGNIVTLSIYLTSEGMIYGPGQPELAEKSKIAELDV